MNKQNNNQEDNQENNHKNIPVDPTFWFIYCKAAPHDKANLHLCRENGTKLCSCSIDYSRKGLHKDQKKKERAAMITEIRVSQFNHYRICGKSHAQICFEIEDINKWFPEGRKVILPDLQDNVIHQY